MTAESAIMIIIMLSLVLAAATITTTIEEAAAQTIRRPPGEGNSLVTPVLDPAMLPSDLLADLENATLLNATLYEDGYAVLLFETKTPQYYPDGERLIIEVHTLHPYASNAGYQFYNGSMYTSAGNEIGMIQRNGTPGVEIVEGEGRRLER